MSQKIFYNNQDLIGHRISDIFYLLDEAKNAPHGLVRLNVHPELESGLQQMFIAISPQFVPTIHKHTDRWEIFTAVKGRATIQIFDDNLKMIESTEITAPELGGVFCYRIPPHTWHALYPKNESFLFLEVSNGPFSPKNTFRMNCDVG